jgi:hypothetical protein
MPVSHWTTWTATLETCHAAPNRRTTTVTQVPNETREITTTLVTD